MPQRSSDPRLARLADRLHSAAIHLLRRVRREGYVPSYLGEFAYEDTPLPIEEEQTISQPYIVAYMVEALELRPQDRVLEIGTGSGYAAAVLAEMTAEVYTIERHERLARTATERLRRDGYANVQVRHGDGTLDWPEAAPFDAIIVTCAPEQVPQPLVDQLKAGGRMIIPVGDSAVQYLYLLKKEAGGGLSKKAVLPVRFVPMTGEAGRK